MAGIVNISFSVPRIKAILTDKIIEPVSGANPVDTGAVQLPNIRGVLDFEITSEDNNFTSKFQIIGGNTDYPGNPNSTFGFIKGTNVNASVTSTATNVFDVVTDAADAGGRTYELIFFPLDSFGSTIERTAGAVIGNNNLVVKIKTYRALLL